MSESIQIIFYGTKWCGDCRRSRKVFSECNVDYVFIDIDLDRSGETFVKSKNHGNRSVPTIIFPDGSMLVEPSDKELKDKLATYQKQ